MKRFLRRYAILSLAAVLAACSDSLPDDNGGLPTGYSRIQLTVSAETPSGGTRAPWNDPNAEDKEMMRYALVVMTKGNKVERVIPVNMTGNAIPWYERHNVGTIAVENGTHTFYSFANISYTGSTTAEGKQTATINGLTFTEDGQVPETLNSATWTAEFNNYAPDADEPIPMTNKEEYEVNGNQSITLHLFRMLSKINFRFTNNTGREINIQQLTLNQATPDGTHIFFLPPKNAGSENIKNDFPDNVNYANAPLTFISKDAPLEVPVKTEDNNKPVEKTFYLNETVSKHETGQMTLTLKIQRRGSETVEERFALMRLSAIPRNTYVTVPVTVTDYDMKLKAFFYAPIGGYPPYTLTEEEKQFICTFSTGGDFALRPFIYKHEDKSNPAKWFELTDKTKVADYTLTIDDPQMIFDNRPHFENGEILGTLKTASGSFKGTASVSLKVMLKTGTDGSVLQEYNRTLYIILDQK